MTGDVEVRLKPKAACEGRTDTCSLAECPIYGTPLRANRDGRRRVKGCGDVVARNKRNRAKGRKKQAKAVTALGVPKSPLKPGHEELLGGTVRVEVKAGGRFANPIWTRYLLAERQSEAARAFGDHRPFVFVAMPDGQTEGLAIVRLSNLHEFTAAMVEQWGAA